MKTSACNWKYYFGNMKNKWWPFGQSRLFMAYSNVGYSKGLPSTIEFLKFLNLLIETLEKVKVLRIRLKLVWWCSALLCYSYWWSQKSVYLLKCDWLEKKTNVSYLPSLVPDPATLLHRAVPASVDIKFSKTRWPKEEKKVSKYKACQV